jgi:membrane protein implicated in regulation of membrane protease activity
MDLEHDLAHDMAHDGPGIFNARIISMFITAFGGCGAISVYLGLGVLISSLIGLAGGFLFGWLVYLFARLLYSQQASSIHGTSDLLGISAQVIVAIPANGLGQVRCIVGESAIEKIARSADGSPIAENTTVFIEEASGETLIVSQQPTEGAGLFLTGRSE